MIYVSISRGFGYLCVLSVEQSGWVMDFLENEVKETESLGITLLFAHGAGAPMDSDFMNEVSALYSKKGIKVVRFEFPYMQERRLNGKKRPPDRAPKLLACWKGVVDAFSDDEGALFIAGKSMGGRMATLLMAEHNLPIKGCVCFGYPYHAPGKPEKVRNDHFSALTQPVLVLQGDRDAFGTRDEIERYVSFDKVQHHWLEDGNHDLKPRKKSGLTHEENIAEAVNVSADWMKSLAI